VTIDQQWSQLPWLMAPYFKQHSNMPIDWSALHCRLYKQTSSANGYNGQCTVDGPLGHA